MNRILLFTLLLAIFSNAIAQNQIKNSPFSYGATYTGDIVSNIMGGIETGTVYLGMMNVSLGFDTEKANLWKGGEFFIMGANTHGAEPTSELIGDFQTVSNIEAGPLTYFHELWYKQAFGKVSIVLGIQDLNAEFVASEYGGNFINSSFGIPSIFVDNISSPIFPNTALGISATWGVNDNFSIRTSVFDGNSSTFDDDPINIEPDFNKNSGFQTFTELQYNYSLFNSKLGTAKTGIFYHNHKLVETEIEEVHNEAYGFYLLVDQQLYNENEKGEGLGFFIQISFSPNDINFDSTYLGFGFVYTGLIPKRGDDALCIGVAHAQVNNYHNKSETAIELNYSAQLNKYISIQPDIQYIINPAGTDNDLDNALVALLRFNFSF